MTAALPGSQPATPRRIAALLAVLLTIGVGLVAHRMAFLCDDAYITFRHVSNAMAGHGLVWNAPPFHPVEGYTGFAWAMLLWAVWAWCGIEPPAAANWLSLGCGLLQFGLVAVVALRLTGRDGRRLPAGVALLALLVVGGNVTFLQWMTGGLETALFNLAVVAWVLLACRAAPQRGTGWLTAWAATAALAALTRPDGQLFVAATAATAGVEALRRSRAWRATVLGLTPLLAVVAHVLWRRVTYGDWLPNTYYAKVTRPWPEAGWRYGYCFLFEHGLWSWPPFALVAGAVIAWRSRGHWIASLLARLPAVAAVAAITAQVGYYLIRVGGDHFEYRVLSHLVPLLVLAAVGLATQASRRIWPAVAWLALTGVTSLVGWVHHLRIAQPQPPGYVRLADQFPAWTRPLFRDYDRHQAWLHLQFNCMRCSSHADSARAIFASLPARAHQEAPADDVLVAQSVAVGIVAWVLPDVAIIDLLGLCDRVAARSPLAEWTAPYLPREALRQAVARADTDADGQSTRSELHAAFAAIPGWSDPGTSTFVELMLLLFAHTRDDALTAAELAAIEPFFADLRWIAHERLAPAGYVAALDPNVTIVDRKVVVRQRTTPLTTERVRAIEAEWFATVQR